MRAAVSSILPPRLKHALRERLGARVYASSSYSQEGEDLVLRRIFEAKLTGTYVDVGAHHPFRFSNTCLLHQKGWRGINVDAMPGAMDAFRRFRPTDVNLELGVSLEPAQLEFFVFEEPALNTFDPELAKQRQSQGWAILHTKIIDCLPLSTILDRELPTLGVDTPDMISIDVEGFDLQVLQSNDWTRYRPLAIVIEVLGQDLNGLGKSDTAGFLSTVGYQPFAKLFHSAVFMRRGE
jgi:FkbM family methyltransferase